MMALSDGDQRFVKLLSHCRLQIYVKIRLLRSQASWVATMESFLFFDYNRSLLKEGLELGISLSIFWPLLHLFYFIFWWLHSDLFLFLYF